MNGAKRQELFQFSKHYVCSYTSCSFLGILIARNGNLITGAPARDVLKDALHDLMAIGEHVRATFERALEQHKVTRSMNEMSMRSGLTSQHTSGSVRDQ
jgi:hypothetical protein